MAERVIAELCDVRYENGLCLLRLRTERGECVVALDRDAWGTLLATLLYAEADSAPLHPYTCQ